MEKLHFKMTMGFEEITTKMQNILKLNIMELSLIKMC